MISDRNPHTTKYEDGVFIIYVTQIGVLDPESYDLHFTAIREGP